MPELEHPRDLLRFGEFELDSAAGELRTAGSTIRLQPQPLKVLLALLRNPGEVVSREQLKHELMSDAAYGDADHALNIAVTKLRCALQDSSEHPHYIHTLPRRGYRFVAKIELSSASQTPDAQPPPSSMKKLYWPLAAFCGLILLVAILLFVGHRSAPTKEKYVVVIAAVTSNTDDAVFDRTLRQGLSSELQHSSVLKPLSDERISRTLSLMRQSPGAPLTESLALQVCQRTAGIVAITHSVAMLGQEYVLELKAVDCRTGDVLADEQATSTSREQVLKTVQSSAAKLRRHLEALLPSLKRNDINAEYVTTPSLEALQSYTLASQAMFNERNESVAIPMFQRAIALDAEFAMAYAQLAALYQNLGQSARAAETIRKAYDLRQHVSAREKLLIEARYEYIFLGDLPSARKQYALAALLYPDDADPLLNLALINTALGECETALAQLERALKITPQSGPAYAALVSAELCRGNQRGAKALAEEAEVRRIDTPQIHLKLFLVSFLQQDTPGMQKESSYLAALPEWNPSLLCLQASTAAYTGRFHEARSLVRRSADLALLADDTENAASCHADAAQWEALVGNIAETRHQAEAALLLANSPDVQGKSAIALALAGDLARASRLADAIKQRFPRNTNVQAEYLPAIRSAIALRNPKSPDALETVLPAESPRPVLCQLYLRGQIYLATAEPSLAIRHFQQILDHPDLLADPIGVLAQLQLGRAYRMNGDAAKAKQSYELFLKLWKDADPAIPALQEAKKEYAPLAAQSTQK